MDEGTKKKIESLKLADWCKVFTANRTQSMQQSQIIIAWGSENLTGTARISK